MIQLRSEADRKQAMAELVDVPADGTWVVEITRKPKQRTLPQNASLHKWCEMMADSLNDAGYDQRTVVECFKDGFELPWTMEAVKHIFRTVAHAMYGVVSTADLTTAQLQHVYDVVDARLSEITGVTIPWPSRESQSTEALIND